MKKLIPIFLVVSTFCIISCMEEEPPAIHQLKEKQLASLIQTYEIDLDTDGGTYSIETDSGCKLQINTKEYGYYYRSDFEKVKGKINLEIIEIFDRGTMAITGKHTMSGDSILISGGEFRIQAYKDNRELWSENFYRIEVPAQITGDFSEEMQLFTRFMEGDVQNTLIDWRLSRNQSDYWGIGGQEDPTSYTMLLSGFGWFNCDKFMNDPREKTELNISFPSKYNNKSIAVYLAIMNEPNSLGMANQGVYPIGLDVHLIFTVEEEDQFLYQIISTKVSDELYEFKSANMKLADPESLKNIINNLE